MVGAQVLSPQLCDHCVAFSMPKQGSGMTFITLQSVTLIVEQQFCLRLLPKAVFFNLFAASANVCDAH